MPYRLLVFLWHSFVRFAQRTPSIVAVQTTQRTCTFARIGLCFGRCVCSFLRSMHCAHAHDVALHVESLLRRVGLRGLRER